MKERYTALTAFTAGFFVNLIPIIEIKIIIGIVFVTSWIISSMIMLND